MREDVLRSAMNGFIFPSLLCGENRRILNSNRAFTDLCEYEADEVLGKIPGRILQGEESDPGTVCEMRRFLDQALPFSFRIVNYDKSDRSYATGGVILPGMWEDGRRFFVGLQRELMVSGEAPFQNRDFCEELGMLVDALSIQSRDMPFAG